MSDQIEINGSDGLMEPFTSLPGDVAISVPLMIGSIALNMAMKYHDLAIIKDGAMYQQYKLEGRNIREINIDQVFETAIKIEHHLMRAPERLMTVAAALLSAPSEAAQVAWLAVINWIDGAPC